MKHICIFAINILLLHSSTKTAAQPAAAPAPAGPLNITAVLEKAGQFGTLIRLMKSTQVSDQINNQLNNSNGGITIFAPTDNAFSSLPAGTLNSLTDQQKVALIQFHIIPSVMTMSQFQTVSNPQVDKVLLPLDIFGAASPAPAPGPVASKKKKTKEAADEPTAGSSKDSASASSGSRLNWVKTGRWVFWIVAASFFWFYFWLDL